MRSDDLQRLAIAVQKSSQNLTPYREICRLHASQARRGLDRGDVRASSRSRWRQPSGTASSAMSANALALRCASRAKQRYRQLADAIPQALWTISGTASSNSSTGRPLNIRASPARRSPTGRGRQIHPQDRELALQCWKESMRQLRLLEVAVRLRRADGVYRWHMVRLTPMGDGRSWIRNWCGISTDIDDMKQAEIARRTDRDRFTSWVNTVPGVLFAFQQWPDGRSCFPFVSPQVAELTPSRSRAWRMTRQRFFSASIPTTFRKRESARLQPPPETLALCVPTIASHPTRGEIWVAGSAIPTRQADGSVPWQGFIADITERKRAGA